MKTKLLKRLRKEAKKQIKIKSNYGGLYPIYTIIQDGVEVYCDINGEIRWDGKFMTWTLAEAITVLNILRRNFISMQINCMRIERRQKEQNRILNL